jgi:hypothetical protein
MFNEQNLSTAVQLALPGAPYARQVALFEFCKLHQMDLYPTPDVLLVVDGWDRGSTNMDNQLPKAVYTYWAATGTTPQIFWAKEKGYDKALYPQNKKIRTKSWKQWQDQGIMSLSQPAQVIETTPWDKEALLKLGNDPAEVQALEDKKLYANQLGSWYLHWVAKQMEEKLSPGEMVELVSLLRKKTEIVSIIGDDNQIKDLGIKVRRDMVEYDFWFMSNRVVSNLSSSEREFLESCSVFYQGCKTLPIIVALLSHLGGLGAGHAKYLANLSNIWDRNDGSYGLKPEDDHATGVAKRNLFLPLGGYAQTVGGNTNKVWPHLVIENARFDFELIANLYQSEGMACPDKYNMKSAFGPTGVQSLLMWQGVNAEGDHVMYTLHDASKPSKWANRPTQARMFSFGHAVLINEEGETPRCQSGMTNRIDMLGETSPLNAPEGGYKQ